MGTVITSIEYPCYVCCKNFSWIYYQTESDIADQYDVKAEIVERKWGIVTLQMKCPHCKHPNQHKTSE